MFRADLHCHTTHSDGSFSPREILDHAKSIGLGALAITDHDAVSAYKDALSYAKQIDILLAPGAEFSCHIDEVSVHILGYDFDSNHPAITTLCQKHQDRRLERNHGILQKLSKKNMFLDQNELYADIRSVGRPHIAKLMIQKGYVSSIEEAFRLYIGEGKSCYERGEKFSVEDTIKIIHSAGGKAFIAHPHLIRQEKIIKNLLQMPMDGIECYYSRFELSVEKRWCKIAEQRGLLISGGSDFHGSFKPDTPLGCSWTNLESFAKIFSKSFSEKDLSRFTSLEQPL